jgi:hypothetical protein
MGASSPLVRLTVRMSPFCRSSPDEIAIWFVGGDDPRDLLMRTPSDGGEPSLFDIFEGRDDGGGQGRKSKFAVTVPISGAFLSRSPKFTSALTPALTITSFYRLRRLGE